MVERFDSLFRLTSYVNPLERRIARNITLVALLILIFVSMGVIALAFIDTEASLVIAYVALLSGVVGAIAAIGLVQRYYTHQGALLIVGFLCFIGIISAFAPANNFYQLPLAWSLAIFATALIAHLRIVLGLGLIGVVTIVITAILREAPSADFFFSTAQIVLILGIALLIARDFETVAKQIQRQMGLRRLQLIEISSAVYTRISARLELEALLKETVELICDQFEEIYHAQVFLIDPQRQFAALRASTGEVGRQLMARHHALAVGTQSVIGQVTEKGTHILASDTSLDPVHKRNELLPETRTELALPLRVREGVIGALDLQSRTPNVFSQEDIEIFQTLADQIAIALENARLIEQVRQQANENLYLLQQEQQNRQEIERLNRELMQSAWRDYVVSSTAVPHQSIDLQTQTVVPHAPISSISAKTFELADVQVETLTDKTIVTVPIKTQGVAVSVLEFELKGQPIITAATRETLNTLGERVGLIAENVRLFETTQQVAASREQLNQLSSQMQGLTTIETLLKVAVAELGQTLGAQAGFIRLVATDQQEEWVEI